MDRQVLDKTYFISFCIEQYKHEKGLSGTETMQLLDSYGVLEYLEANFDSLHTQSRLWILEDIDDFINIRRKEIRHDR